MVLNALRFAPKRSAFWCKTQAKMLLNVVQNARVVLENRQNKRCVMLEIVDVCLLSSQHFC